jgi:hypothetical protein
MDIAFLFLNSWGYFHLLTVGCFNSLDYALMGQASHITGGIYMKPPQPEGLFQYLTVGHMQAFVLSIKFYWYSECRSFLQRFLVWWVLLPKEQNIMWEGCRWCLQQISILVSSYSFHGQLVLIFELRKPPFPFCPCREIRLTFLELLDCPTNKLVYSMIWVVFAALPLV